MQLNSPMLDLTTSPLFWKKPNKASGMKLVSKEGQRGIWLFLMEISFYWSWNWQNLWMETRNAKFTSTARKSVGVMYLRSRFAHLLENIQIIPKRIVSGLMTEISIFGDVNCFQWAGMIGQTGLPMVLFKNQAKEQIYTFGLLTKKKFCKN